MLGARESLERRLVTPGSRVSGSGCGRGRRGSSGHGSATGRAIAVAGARAGVDGVARGVGVGSRQGFQHVARAVRLLARRAARRRIFGLALLRAVATLELRQRRAGTGGAGRVRRGSGRLASRPRTRTCGTSTRTKGMFGYLQIARRVS